MTQADNALSMAIVYQRIATESYAIARRYMRFGPARRAIHWQRTARNDWKVYEYYMNTAILYRKQGR